MYWNVNNLQQRTISQKLPIDNFEWEENLFKFYKSFLENQKIANTKFSFQKITTIGIYLNLMLKILNIYKNIQ